MSVTSPRDLPQNEQRTPRAFILAIISDFVVQLVKLQFQSTQVNNLRYWAQLVEPIFQRAASQQLALLAVRNHLVY